MPRAAAGGVTFFGVVDQFQAGVVVQQNSFLAPLGQEVQDSPRVEK